MTRGRTRLTTVAAAVVLAGTVSLSAAAQSAPSPDRAEPSSPLAQVLRQERAEHRVPGMQGTIVRGSAIAAAVAGTRKLDSGDPVRLGHYFHLGSLTKAVTATAIGRLVEEGRLSWTSTPAEIFPRQAEAMDPELRRVSLVQLLSHRAGIQRFLYAREYADLPNWSGSPTDQRRSFTNWLLRRPPRFEPGTYHYGNANYVIAAAMASQVSHLSWEALVVSRVLAPLGMTWKFGWPAECDPHQPWGHFIVDGRLVPAGPHWAADFRLLAGPAVDLSLTPRDYGKFLRTHLLGLRGVDDLLTAQTIKRLHRPIGDYAMGWLVTEVNGVRTSIHDGTIGPFYAYGAIQPSRNLAVATLVNAGNPRGGRASFDALLRLLTR